jgi:hypothetical protein
MVQPVVVLPMNPETIASQQQRLTSGTHIMCLLQNNYLGSVTVNFSGGTSPYTVSFNGAYTRFPIVVYSGLAANFLYNWMMPKRCQWCNRWLLLPADQTTQPAAAVTTVLIPINCWNQHRVLRLTSAAEHPVHGELQRWSIPTGFRCCLQCGLCSGYIQLVSRDANGNRWLYCQRIETITQPAATVTTSGTPCNVLLQVAQECYS